MEDGISISEYWREVMNIHLLTLHALEDETGVANVVVWPDCFERFRATLLKARLLAVEGKIQKEGIVIHVVAETLTDMTARLAKLTRP